MPVEYLRATLEHSPHPMLDTLSIHQTAMQLLLIALLSYRPKYIGCVLSLAR